MGSETSNFGEKARGSKLLPALCVHGAGGAAKCSLQGLLTTLVIISTTQTPALRPPAASASQALHPFRPFRLPCLALTHRQRVAVRGIGDPLYGVPTVGLAALPTAPRQEGKGTETSV